MESLILVITGHNGMLMLLNGHKVLLTLLYDAMMMQDAPARLRWVAAMRPEEAAFLKDLPFTLSIPSHRLLIVHAGMVPTRPRLSQRFLDLYAVRASAHCCDGAGGACMLLNL